MKRLTPLLLTLPLTLADDSIASASSMEPYFPHDSPVPDCIFWHNNIDTSCAALIDFWHLPTPQFFDWNPLLDPASCVLVKERSYCIQTETQWRAEGGEEWLSSYLASLTGTPTPTSRVVHETTSSTISTPAPSPTEWESLGCYVEDAAMPLMDVKMKEGEGVSVKDCQDVCWRAEFEFVGVKEGNQCWCGTYVGGEWTRNQEDCNLPCPGDRTVMCGGRGLLNVYRSVENVPVSTTAGVSGTTVETGSVTRTGAVVASNTADSGARRFGVMFF